MKHLVYHRYWWFLLSLIVILPGLYFLLLNPLITTGTFQLGLKSSIDFSGGALWEIHFPEKKLDELNTERIRQIFTDNGFDGSLVQISTIEVKQQPVTAVVVRSRAVSGTDSANEQQHIIDALTATYETPVQLERLESVGPTVSKESTRSAIIAVIGASIVILLYLTFAFRKAPHPVRYGVCAILAMLHDLLLVLGIAAILGTFMGLEVDALFLTAVLTILSFSVHDTIVVFDRIRENLINRKTNETFNDIVNHSIVQTLPRSINTQLTTLFTLTALLLFGGTSIRHFVTIMLIGLVSGTYSSIFNAAQILVVWEHEEWKHGFKRVEDTSSSSPSATVTS